ncbi:MAG: type II toxin-antitoxin system prevent-host-death family antitoxin [Thermoanaerobaculia bacterium]|nr:type II toxin-antitoxin system prevent-host-death family antitoxin [Thermoanaerobaculia bacterium]
MSSVNLRDLRNRGGEVVERVARGASVIVTKGGVAVAVLQPIPKPALDRETLFARFSRLPAVDPIELRRDLDKGLDPAL